MPENSKVHISRDLAWNWAEASLDATSTFTVYALSSEVVSVTVSVPGYAIDSSRLRYQIVGRNSFALPLREDRHDILIPLEKRL
jgi:hypothetical protein